MSRSPRALTIAGSDPSGAAGVQRDLRTFESLGVWGTSVVTAVTVQDTATVHAVHPVPPDVVAAQIRSVVADVGVDAAKTGMLGSAETVEAVARALREAEVRALVVDPVLWSTAGDRLAEGGVVEALIAELMPQCMLATPNAVEAAALTGWPVQDVDSQVRAAHELRGAGAGAVVVTGGHVPGPVVTDVLVDETGVVTFEHPRVQGDTRGGGCLFSAAVTALLARGADVREAVRQAGEHAARAIANATVLGSGPPVAGPVATR